MTMFGWSASHSFTLASSFSNWGFRLPGFMEKILNFMLHPSLGENSGHIDLIRSVDGGTHVTAWRGQSTS